MTHCTSPRRSRGVLGALVAGALAVHEAAAYLATNGTTLVDLAAGGAPVKLACANWYGLDQQDYVMGGLQFVSPQAVAAQIRAAGFNCVRLPFSVEIVLSNPPIAARAVTAYPPLQGKKGMDAFDVAVEVLTGAGLFVILDNHVSRADWCCSTTDGQGLWYTDEWPESSWLQALTTVVSRYGGNPRVIGVDLRNELRSAVVGGQTRTPTWGGGSNATDWASAAERGGAAVLGANENMLVIVEGLNYATDLTGVAGRPIRLPVSGRLVYEAHNYVFDNGYNLPYDVFKAGLMLAFGYIAEPGHPYSAPLWLGEMGTCNTDVTDCVQSSEGKGLWWPQLMQFLNETQINWGYWAIDGTQSTGTGRTFGAPETYGLLNTTWNGIASLPLLKSLQSVMS